MKHYHGKTRDDIIRNPDDVGPCYYMVDTPDGLRRKYFCEPSKALGKTARKRAKRKQEPAHAD